MKIICVDNFDRDPINDKLIAANIQSKRIGEIMVKALNDNKELETIFDYYRLVEDNYKLHKFKP